MGKLKIILGICALSVTGVAIHFSRTDAARAPAAVEPAATDVEGAESEDSAPTAPSHNVPTYLAEHGTPLYNGMSQLLAQRSPASGEDRIYTLESQMMNRYQGARAGRYLLRYASLKVAGIEMGATDDFNPTWITNELMKAPDHAIAGIKTVLPEVKDPAERQALIELAAYVGSNPELAPQVGKLLEEELSRLPPEEPTANDVTQLINSYFQVVADRDSRMGFLGSALRLHPEGAVQEIVAQYMRYEQAGDTQ